MTAYKPSNANLIHRVPKSDTAPYGIVQTITVPTDVPVLVAFGGELTYADQFANSYASMLNTLMTENKITGVEIYSVVYEFGSRDAALERAELFRAAGRKISVPEHPTARATYERQLRDIKENEPVPNYVKKLFDILLRPRISDDAGHRLPMAESMARTGRIKFYAHCHGAAAIYQMGEMMHAEMLRLGYTPDEITRVQKNLLVVQHGPLGPLNKQRFTTLSFGSAEDTMMQNHKNQFAKWIYDNSPDIVPSFFGEPNGNVFVAGHLKVASFQEHDHKGLLKSDEEMWPLTDDGKIIFAAERNALINGARHSIRGGPMPGIAELVNGDGVNFEELRQNGNYIFNLMMSDLHLQNQERGHQK